MNLRQKLLLLTAGLSLASCGFTPIYGEKGGDHSVIDSLNGVAIANIPDRQGQRLRNHLIDRMYPSGRPEHPEARLLVKLKGSTTDLGVLKNATSTRKQYNLWADYTLQTLEGKELLKGLAHSVVSYSAIDAQYGLLATERDAEKRATTEVGEQIVNRLSLYYAEIPHDKK